MRVYQFRHVGLVLQSSLDVAVEFRYDIRLCRFALDQLSFRFCAGCTFAATSHPTVPFAKRPKV
jgi:hypothetical protein